MVLTKKDYNEYLNILTNYLVRYFNLSKEDAFLAVSTSTVEKILHDDRYADIQLHQPIQSTAEEIFDEYVNN